MGFYVFSFERFDNGMRASTATFRLFVTKNGQLDQ